MHDKTLYSWFLVAEPKVLVKSSDFYMFPRLSPDGQMLAWMEWRHPNMPWDRTSIWVGKLSDDGYACDCCLVLVWMLCSLSYQIGVNS